MRIFLLVILCFSSVEASEHYQLKNSVGFWKAWENPWHESHLQIRLEWNGIAIKYCDPLEVELNGICVENQPWYGSGYYNSVTDAFDMIEFSSPHGKYILKVSKKDPRVLMRLQGRKTIEYTKVLTSRRRKI